VEEASYDEASRFNYDEGYTPDVELDMAGAISRGYGRMITRGTGRIKVKRRKDLNMNIKIQGDPVREWDLEETMEEL
jgi:hypothetical protein